MARCLIGTPATGTGICVPKTPLKHTATDAAVTANMLGDPSKEGGTGCGAEPADSIPVNQFKACLGEMTFFWLDGTSCSDGRCDPG